MSPLPAAPLDVKEAIQKQLATYPFDRALKLAFDIVKGDENQILKEYARQIQICMLNQPTYFDEVFYLDRYPEIFAEVKAGVLSCGLHHFAGWGVFEGRSPNERWHVRMANNPASSAPLSLDSNSYCAAHVEVMEFLQEFRQMSVDQFARIYGTRLGHFTNLRQINADEGASTSERLKLMRAFFDPDYYCEKYLSDRVDDEAAFNDYIERGARNGSSPNAHFDERFYLAFYPDIAQAVRQGALLCGFEHWISSGQREGRLHRFELSAALEVMAPGVTAPVALNGADLVAAKLEPCAFEVTEDVECRIWFILPFLNPDMMFGGFTSILEFIEQALVRGVRIGLFLREAHVSQVEYYKYRSKSQSKLLQALDYCPIFSPHDNMTFKFSRQDLFVSYSVWDGHWARRFAQHTRWKKPVYWIQEYEPIFHKHDTWHFLSASAYHYEHVGVFNSGALLEYFLKLKIGRYKDKRLTRFLTFEHLLWHPGAQISELTRRRGGRRTLFLYARPEEHASRNMFGLAVYCLRRAIEKQIFKGSWRFIGAGALGGPYRIPLGFGSSLEVQNRLDPQDYAQLIASIDVGFSLMHAPHPSLLPYEMARAGAAVVTNVFPGREAAYIKSRSSNIIVFDGTVDAAVDALENAVQRCEAGTIRPEEPDNLYPDTRLGGWEIVFDDNFFNRLAALIDPEFTWGGFAGPGCVTHQT